MKNNYPIISLTDASDILNSHKKGTITPEEINQKISGDFDDNQITENINNVLHKLIELAESEGLPDSKKFQNFEAQASIVLHSESGIESSWARDAGFWRWVTFGNECTGAILIDLRHGKNTPGTARDVYYGFGRPNEGFLSFLWMRANSVYTETDKYSLVTAVNDIDFWWSHVIRIDHGCCKFLVRAFIKFVQKNNISRGNSNNKNVNAGFRDLAKELRRRFPTTAFEMMDDEGAYKFVEELWSEREIWCGKS